MVYGGDWARSGVGESEVADPRERGHHGLNVIGTGDKRRQEVVGEGDLVRVFVKNVGEALADVTVDLVSGSPGKVDVPRAWGA